MPARPNRATRRAAARVGAPERLMIALYECALCGMMAALETMQVAQLVFAFEPARGAMNICKERKACNARRQEKIAGLRRR